MKKAEVIFAYDDYKIVSATPLTRFLFGYGDTRYFMLKDKKFLPVGGFSCIFSAVAVLFERVPSIYHRDLCLCVSDELSIPQDHLLTFCRFGDYVDHE